MSAENVGDNQLYRVLNDTQVSRAAGFRVIDGADAAGDGDRAGRWRQGGRSLVEPVQQNRTLALIDQQRAEGRSVGMDNRTHGHSRSPRRSSRVAASPFAEDLRSMANAAHPPSRRAGRVMGREGAGCPGARSCRRALHCWSTRKSAPRSPRVPSELDPVP
jgi:hypothetical protein